MKYNGFMGGSYELDSLFAECTRTVNLIPEAIESGTGKSAVRMFRRPGLVTHCDFSTSTPVEPLGQAIHVFDEAGVERVFVLTPSADTKGALWEVDSAGSPTKLCDGFARPAVAIASSGSQVMIACHETAGSTLYCYDLTAKTLTEITSLSGHSISRVLWHPHYCFVALDIPAKKIYLSSLMDGSLWDAGDTAQVFVDDSPTHMLIEHEELWIFGHKSLTVYYDAGYADFPLAPIPGVGAQLGAISNTPARCDNTIFWVSEGERGGPVVWRANGYTPQRISNHAIETLIASADPDDDDFSAFSVDYKGHAFYCITVNGLDTMLVYDASTGLWHEWGTGMLSAVVPFIGHSPIYAWNMHLFASRTENKIYKLSDDVFTDDATTCEWMRRAPHLAEEAKWIFYSRLTLDVETGVTGASDPQVWMRYSNDGGRNFNTAQSAGMGAAGQTHTRVYWGPLGAARDRVFEVSGSDPVPITITDAFLDLTLGTK